MQSLDTGAAAQQKHPARQSCISNRYILLVQVRFVNTGVNTGTVLLYLSPCVFFMRKARICTDTI